MVAQKKTFLMQFSQTNLFWNIDLHKEVME